MADSSVAITAGSGTSIDTRTEATNGNHRQVVVLGDPSTNAGVAPVDATNGLSVNVTNASIPVTGTFYQATQPVSLASVPSHNVTNAGTFAVQSASAGDVAHDSVDSGNPVKVGGKAVSSEPTAVASGDRANLITDLVGKLITLPYANPENFVSGATAAITDTTSTSVIAAAGAGVRNFITSILVTNSHATVGTLVTIKDGSGGTTLYAGYAAAAGGGFSVTFPTPLRGSANTALHAACGTTGSNVYVSAAGYKGA